MFRKDMLHSEALEQHLEQTQIGYLTCKINLIKLPSLIKRCEADLDTATPEMKEVLTNQIKAHKADIKNNEEQMQSLSEIYDGIKSFKESLGA